MNLAARVIGSILRHDKKVNSYKIALVRAVNDVVLSYPDLVDAERDVADAVQKAFVEQGKSLPREGKVEVNPEEISAHAAVGFCAGIALEVRHNATRRWSARRVEQDEPIRPI